MRLATRIRAADPLAAQLPGELTPPALVPGYGVGERPSGPLVVGRRWPTTAASAAVACLVVAVLVAIVLALRPAPETGSGDVVRTFNVSSASGGPAPAALVARSLEIMRQRLAALNATDSRVSSQGPTSISLYCADCGSSASSAAQRVTETAQLLFYDWEANVLDARCRPSPAADAVTGGLAAGLPGAGTVRYYGAVLRASRCPARHYRLMSHTAPVYYAVDATHRRVLAGPATSRSAALAAARATERDGQFAETLEVLPGTTVMRAEPNLETQVMHGNDAADPNDASWYVLRDDPALTGDDIVDPRAGVDQVSGSPLVSFDFTPLGRETWHAVTRRIAQRGLARHTPGEEPGAVVQHFAVALDNRLLTVAVVDFRENPDGIDGRRGVQIEGGFTPGSARTLASLLRYGSLPVRLALTSSHPAASQ
jgi:SecD/SecF fusion protein